MVNYHDCIYVWTHKLNPNWIYVGQAKDFNKRTNAHLKNNKDKDKDSYNFDKIFKNKEDWEYKIMHENVDLSDPLALDALESSLIGGLDAVNKGLNIQEGSNFTIKDNKKGNLRASFNLESYTKRIKTWNLPYNRGLFTLKGVKNNFNVAKPHIDSIPSLIDIMDFYEPFAGAANISKHLANTGRFHDDLTLHLNDGNLLNYYRLRAIKESPEELIEGIQAYIPDNLTGVKEKEKDNPKGKKILDSISKWITDEVHNLNLSKYSLDLAIKLFCFIGGDDHKLYYMFDGVTNQSGFKSNRRLNGRIVRAKHIYDGTTIREFSEFLNYYNTVITGMDYYDLPFKKSTDTYIYCDSPYPDSDNSSPPIDMNEYKSWLRHLYNYGYNFSLSCNHEVYCNISKYLNDNDCKFDYKHLETDYGDGVLSTFRSSDDIVNTLPYTPMNKSKSIQGKLC
jgi:hypothetical protein